GGGGGVRNDAGCTLLLSNCTVTANLVTFFGVGGGLANNGTVGLVNCTVAANQAASGGGIYNFAGLLNLSSSTVVSNKATSAIGGVYNYPVAGSVATVRSSIIAS